MMTRWMIAAALMVAPAAAVAQGYDEGDWVLAQFQGGRYWFPGVVERSGGGSVTIVYDDGDRETRPANQVKSYNWQVGSSIQCVWKADGQWYAAKITTMGDDGETLRIRYDDGTVEQTRTKKCRSL